MDWLTIVAALVQAPAWPLTAAHSLTVEPGRAAAATADVRLAGRLGQSLGAR